MGARSTGGVIRWCVAAGWARSPGSGQHGGVSAHRREGALVVAAAASWRLDDMGASWIWTGSDLTNAFGCLDHGSLDEVTDGTNMEETTKNTFRSTSPLGLD